MKAYMIQEMVQLAHPATHFATPLATPHRRTAACQTTHYPNLASAPDSRTTSPLSTLRFCSASFLCCDTFCLIASCR